MGIDYTVTPLYGFAVENKELIKKFSAKQEQISHTEKRFDQRTGVQLEDEEVVDQEEGRVFTFNGETLEFTGEMGFNDLIDAIADHLSCESSYTADRYDEWDYEEGEVFFFPRTNRQQSTYEGKITIEGGFTVTPKMTTKLAALRAKLVKLGLHPKGPIVTATLLIH